MSIGVVAGIAWALRRADVRYVVYEALPWPSAPWLAASLMFFGLALVLSVPAVWRAVLAVLGCCSIGLAVAWLVGAPMIGAGRGEEVESYPAPQAQHRVVVHRGGFFDPIYFLSIEQQTGFAARSWYLGCLDGDYDWIEEAGWIEPGVFEMVTSGDDHPIRIVVDPTTGQPIASGQIATDCDFRP